MKQSGLSVQQSVRSAPAVRRALQHDQKHVSWALSSHPDRPKPCPHAGRLCLGTPACRPPHQHTLLHFRSGISYYCHAPANHIAAGMPAQVTVPDTISSPPQETNQSSGAKVRPNTYTGQATCGLEAQQPAGRSGSCGSPPSWPASAERVMQHAPMAVCSLSPLCPADTTPAPTAVSLAKRFRGTTHLISVHRRLMGLLTPY